MTLSGCTVMTEDFSLKRMDVSIENGKIIGLSTPAHAQEKGLFLLPGLIDVHVHGICGDDVMDEGEGVLSRISKNLAKGGVTAFLPTTMSAGAEKLRRVLNRPLNFEGAKALGFHLEGPYIAREFRGAHAEETLRPPTAEEVGSFNNLKMITIAPELPGAMELIESAGCVMSIGHSGADYETAISAMEKGARCLTHTFNAMPPMLHRNPGIIGAAVEKGIYAQIIADGVHIQKSVLLAAYKMFGADRLVLISDGTRATGLGDGEFELGGRRVTVKDGVARTDDGKIAGSTFTLWDGVCNMAKIAGFENAVKMATATPAALLGEKEKGSVRAGMDADFILVDKDSKIVDTIIGGKSLFGFAQ